MLDPRARSGPVALSFATPSLVALLVVVFLVVALPVGALAAAGGVPLAADEGGSAVRSFSGSSGGDLAGQTPAQTPAQARAQTTAQTPAQTRAQTTGDDADAIRLRTELAQTDERGTVGVTTRAAIPDRVTALDVTLLSVGASDAVDADGFVAGDGSGPGESVWEWDGETATPSLTYTVAANDTVDRSGPFAVDGTYRFADAGEWALVQTPRVAAAWSYTGQYAGQVRLDRETVVTGEGVASRSMAFLGPHEEYVHEAAGQRYRLIVPDAAAPVAEPAAVFGVFADAATALRVGARDDEVVAFVAPTGTVSWGVRGLQTGDADLWVRDEEPTETVTDVWTHEYVHTRQAYRAEASGRWITEASATHYAALFALDRGAADFDAFERTLARGEREPAAAAVLAAPRTWAGNADYTKGALVAGEIDRRLRTATDGAASLATVLRELNEADEPITNAHVLDAVEAAAATGADDATAAEIRAAAERLTTTRTTAEMWDREAHAAAFGETPAQVGYELATDGVRATGEYRNRPVARDPVELVVGESLDATVAVSNTGGTAGEYDLSLSVDGEPVANRSGTLDAGAERVEEFEHRFEATGEYAVRIGSERLTVAVSKPARPRVRRVTTDTDRVAAGESVVATATVGNDATVPAGGAIAFRVDGESVATAPVQLDAGAETTVERAIALGGGSGPLGDTGPFGGGSENVTVRATGPVDEASTTVTVEGDGPISADGVPGFGPVVALVSLVVAGACLARRGGRRSE